MTPSKDTLTQTVQDLIDFKFNLLQSIKLLRWIGYGLLLVVLISLGETLIPFRLMNQNWEFEAFRQIIERIPIPLMGFILVFHGQRHGRKTWELRLLRWISWSTLVFGLLLLLSIPLGIVNTVRIDNINGAQYNLVTTQREQNFDTLQKRLDQAETPEQLGRLALVLKRPDLAQKLTDPEQIPIVKEQLTQLTTTNRTQQQTQAAQLRAGQRTQLLKQSIKLNLMALIGGILLIGLFRATQWARPQSQSRSGSQK